MADASHLTVTLEQALHRLLCEVLQEFSDREGVQVLELRAEWLHADALTGPRSTIRSIELRTLMRHP